MRALNGGSFNFAHGPALVPVLRTVVETLLVTSPFFFPSSEMLRGGRSELRLYTWWLAQAACLASCAARSRWRSGEVITFISCQS
jgi:hypothetical protein